MTSPEYAHETTEPVDAPDVREVQVGEGVTISYDNPPVFVPLPDLGLEEHPSERPVPTRVRIPVTRAEVLAAQALVRAAEAGETSIDDATRALAEVPLYTLDTTQTNASL